MRRHGRGSVGGEEGAPVHHLPAVPSAPLPLPPIVATPGDFSSSASSTDEPVSSTGSEELLLADLPIAPNSERWEDVVHECVWRAGRAFGFQAFNINPSSRGFARQQFVPATIFVASDHLCSILVKSFYLREKNTTNDEERFARAVWELHSHIFLNYHRWCKAVGLPARAPQAEALLEASPSHTSPSVVHGLLAELASYFLLYTEGANMRHMPEALWFFYWTAVHSEQGTALWAGGAAAAAAGEEEEGRGFSVPVPGGRARRVALRNMLQSDIAHLQHELHHAPSAQPLPSPARCAELLASLLQGRLHVPTGELTGPDVGIFLDLLAHGDGGYFLDRVVTPVFYVMSYEMDHLFNQGEEVAHRLGYDDANESLTTRSIVHRTLRLLGVPPAALRDVRGTVKAAMQQGQGQGPAGSASPYAAAYAGITRLGCPSGPAANADYAAAEAGAGAAAAAAAAADEEDFDPQVAAAFWSGRVFVKTYRERRSWLAIFRAFFRVFALNAAMAHLLLVAAFYEGRWSTKVGITGISSVVITHAFAMAFERVAHWWMTRQGVRDLLDRREGDTAWLQGRHGKDALTSDKKKAAKAKKDGQEEPHADPEASPAAAATAAGAAATSTTAATAAAAARPAPKRSPLAEAHASRRSIPLEGQPALGVFGVVEWVVVAVGLTAFFVMQYMANPMQQMAKDFWLFAAGGYTAAILAHGLFTTRDGYAVSLTSALHLPGIFTARPRAECWLEGDMSIGWGNLWLTVLFWVQCLALKGVFDYFVIMRPLTGPISVVFKLDWLGCEDPYYYVGTMKLPLKCIGGDWLLVAVRCVPFFMVVFMDSSVFYQITLIIWGLAQGITNLDIGVIADWDSLIREFHKGPLRWWTKGLSGSGNRSRRTLVAFRRANAAQLGDIDSTASLSSLSGSGSSGSGDSSHNGVAGVSASPSLQQLQQQLGPAARAAAALRAAAAGRSHRSSGSIGGMSDDGSAFSADFAGQMLGGVAGGQLPLPSPGGQRGAGSGSGQAQVQTRGGRRTPGGSAEDIIVDAAIVPTGATTIPGEKEGKEGKGGLFGGKKRAGSSFKKHGVKNMQFLLGGQSDDHVAMWDSFATAWDAIVEDLREADLISNRERDMLRFVRLAYDKGLELSGVRPILLPAFFYAGQIQAVVDKGMVGPQQVLVLNEARCLMTWLGCQLGLLPAPLAEALMRATFCTEVVDLPHSQSRERLLRAGVRLLAAVQEVAAKPVTHHDLKRRQGFHSEANAALVELLKSLEVECHAVTRATGGLNAAGKPCRTKGAAQGLTGEDVAAAETLLAECEALRGQLAADPSLLSNCLMLLHDSDHPTSDTASSSHSAASSASSPLDVPMTLRVVATLLRILTLTPAAAKPASAEAQRILGFFMSSLANRHLTKPLPLDEMKSWTVLTPCYEEDVLYPLEASDVAAQLGLQQGRPGAVTDLLTETEDKVSLMAYLRSIFPHDWTNFKERLGDTLGLDLASVTEEDFAPGTGPLNGLALQLQLWASYRGQLLARTVRGMMCYDRALRVLARLENPQPPNMRRQEYERWVDSLVSAKFNYVVSVQVYGRNRSARDLRQRWLAEGVDTLLEEFGRLRAAFLDSAPAAPGAAPAQYSVLIRGKRPEGPHEWEALEFLATQRVEEEYRVRLPANRFTNRGVIIGEGKPENQNHAVIFCFGEALQTIDMNQDNHVSEALKMRNLLNELNPDTKGKALHPAELAPSPAAPVPAASYRKALAKVRASEKPVALVGFREWIFSDSSGALGSFAASAEFAFGTIVQRTMDAPARVRMHYGHPDLFNKVYAMTRGGVSKATRQLHISEDIFGGYNHTLRGGRIKYREYIAVGKGRDMGFDSINAFEIKISGGAGEVLISRDLWRVATRMDFFRLLHFYHSGCGYYINTWILMATVYAQIFALIFFAFARASTVYEQIPFAPPPPPPPGPLDPNMVEAIQRQAEEMALRVEQNPSLGYYGIDLQDTLRVEHVLQLGTLSLLPYIAELLLEHGLLRACLTFLGQFVAGSFCFFIFKQQTTAHYFQDDVVYGGACYIGTGRGFSITTSQFIKIYTNYARSHIYWGFDMLSLCILLFIVKDCADCNYGALSWGTWLVAVSLIVAPFWFNPLVFDLRKVKRDFVAFKGWLAGEVDPETGTTWHSWNAKTLAKIRDDRKCQTDHWANVFWAVVMTSLAPMLLALAAVSRLDIHIDVNLPETLSPIITQIVASNYLVFIITTAFLWGIALATVSLMDRFKSQARQRQWRLYSFWTAAAVVVLFTMYLAVLSKWYAGSGITNLLVIIYANANVLLALHRAATHLATRSPAARAAVDRGYHAIDTCIGYVLLGFLALCSWIGIVGWLQSRLLFNASFAHSISRGSIIQTIGGVKSDGVVEGAAEVARQRRAAAEAEAAQLAMLAGPGPARPGSLTPAMSAASVGSSGRGAAHGRV